VHQEAADGSSLADRRVNKLGHVEVLTRRHEIGHRRVEYVEPRADEKALVRLLLDRDDPITFDLHGPERNVDVIFADRDRRVVTTVHVIREHLLEVRQREQIPVHHDERMMELRTRRHESTGGTEELRLFEVADVQTPTTPIAAEGPDLFSMEVDREQYLDEALVAELAQDGLQKRPVPHLQERLRRPVGERREPAATTADHEHDLVGTGGRLRLELVQHSEVDDARIPVDKGHLPDGPLPHEVKQLGARCPDRDGQGIPMHDLGHGRVEPDTAKERAANVAVGDRAQEPARRIEDERYRGAALVDRLDSLSHRRIRRDGGGTRVELGSHDASLPQARSSVRAARAIVIPLDGIVILGSASEGTNILYHGVRTELPVKAVILEERVGRLPFIRRRIGRLGLPTVVGQVLFQALAAPLLGAAAGQRRSSILREGSLDPGPIPDDRIRHVPSANSTQAIELLRELDPRVVLLSGTRVLSRELLRAVPARFVNVHAGITPRYRGVHGAYWSLVARDPEHCGVTVHFVDTGIDTGPVIAQTTIRPTDQDNITTYPLLQLAAALPLLRAALRQLMDGDEFATVPGTGPSRLWSHPTLWGYVLDRVGRGVR
jgi:hypothetical protein